MKMNQLEIGINGDEIVLRQVNKDVFITPDQADMVVEEIKKIAKFLKQEENENAKHSSKK